MEEKVNFIEETDKLMQLFKEFEKVIKQKCRELKIVTDNESIESLLRN